MCTEVLSRRFRRLKLVEWSQTHSVSRKLLILKNISGPLCCLPQLRTGWCWQNWVLQPLCLIFKNLLSGFSLAAHNSSSSVEAKAVATEAATSLRGDLAHAPAGTSRISGSSHGSSASSLNGESLFLGNPLAFPSSGLAWPGISHL